MYTLSPDPKDSVISFRANDRIQFRHYWVVDEKGYGKPINIRLKRKTADEQAIILAHVNILSEKKPRTRDTAPVGLRQEVMDKYFEPIEQLGEQKGFEIEIAADGVVTAEGVPEPDAHEFARKYDDLTPYLVRINRLTIRVDELEREKKNFEQRIGDLQRACEEKDRRLNAHCHKTLKEALADFQVDYKPDSDTKKNVESRVRSFLYGSKTPEKGKYKGRPSIAGLEGGDGRLLVSVTPAEIDKWIDDYPTESKITRIHLAANLSVFFNTCRRLYRLSSSPMGRGVTKPRGDLLAIARKRAPPAIKDAEKLIQFLNSFIDPEKLPDDREGLHWQSWCAFACLAGPRWNEQQNLLCSSLDLKAQPPRATIQATDEADVKTVGNVVPIESKILLPIMREYAATWKPAQVHVWESLAPRRHGDDDDSTNNCWSYQTFYRYFKRARDAARKRAPAGFQDDPLWSFGPDEWRHTFGTLLALSGHSLLEIKSLMRNSSDVAGAHYVNFNPMDARLEGRLKW